MTLTRVNSGFEAVVVGAGPAGCTAARELARQGQQVLLIDKAALPRTKSCAGGVTRRALGLLPPDLGVTVEHIGRADDDYGRRHGELRAWFLRRLIATFDQCSGFVQRGDGLKQPEPFVPPRRQAESIFQLLL